MLVGVPHRDTAPLAVAGYRCWRPSSAGLAAPHSVSVDKGCHSDDSWGELLEEYTQRLSRLVL